MFGFQYELAFLICSFLSGFIKNFWMGESWVYGIRIFRSPKHGIFDEMIFEELRGAKIPGNFHSEEFPGTFAPR